MRHTNKQVFAVVLTLLVMLGLIGAVESDRWFVGHRTAEGYLVDGPAETRLGLRSYEERQGAVHTRVTIGDLADRLHHPDRPGRWYSGEMVSDTEFLALAGQAVLVLGALSILSLGFCLVSAVKPNRLSARVSPRGLACLLLLGNVAITPPFLTHVALGMNPTLIPMLFWAASITGIVAVELLTRAFARDAVAAELPLAYTVA